jgi:hypothetical protein
MIRFLVFLVAAVLSAKPSTTTPVVNDDDDEVEEKSVPSTLSFLLLPADAGMFCVSSSSL